MHQFITNPELNKIYEFATMPIVLYFDSEKFLEALEKEDLQLFNGHDLKLLIDLQSQLKKHNAAIRDFFVEDELSFFTLLFSNFPLDARLDHTLFDYLQRIQQLSDKELLKGILYAALARGLHIKHQLDLEEKADLMTSDASQLMAWLNSSDYSKEMKWRLLQLSQSPKEELSRFEALMRQLEPIFIQYYAPFQTQLEEDTNHLLEKIALNSPNPLAALTDGILDDNLLPDGTIQLFISYFQPYQIGINTTVDVPIMFWGKHIEVFMAYQQKQKEDALNDHVRIFKNLGDKTRYQVTQMVAQGINSTKTIADQLGVTPATISYHLNQLTNAKILKLESIDGKFQYVVNQQQIENTISALSKHLNLKS